MGRVQRRDPVNFGGFIPYKEDDYNSMKKLAQMERKRHINKLLEVQEGKPFYTK